MKYIPHRVGVHTTSIGPFGGLTSLILMGGGSTGPTHCLTACAQSFGSEAETLEREARPYSSQADSKPHVHMNHVDFSPQAEKRSVRLARLSASGKALAESPQYSRFSLVKGFIMYLPESDVCVLNSGLHRKALTYSYGLVGVLQGSN